MSEAICTWPSCGHTAKGQCGLRLVFDPVTRSAVRINPPPDLPPTLSAALQLPEVVALVEALDRAIEAIDAAYDGPDDNGAYTVRARPALAAIKEPKI